MRPAGLACPCGRTDPRGKALAFDACCGLHLDHNVPAPDAESLMRSRYSAFALGRVEYLLTSWHVSTRPAELTLEPGMKWLGLEVKHHRLIDDTHAGEGGRWFYVNGDLK
ncbi:MAG: hypothetical protein MUF44_15125 [Hydrogenophaga sp.]|nr:hypothetical protein [Hydrogenophaga sp.]